MTARATEERRCRLSGYAGAPTAAVVRVAVYDRGTRLRRAAGALAVAWLAAIGSAFIPLAHFVLVPGWFVAGLVLFRAQLDAAEVALGGWGTCPDCGCEQALDVKGRWDLPRSVTCVACQRGLTLARAPD